MNLSPPRLTLLAILAVFLVALPWIAPTNATLSIATQMLVWTVMALSYNISFGQTGLLSFCHAVFFGAGAFAASHAVNAAAGEGLLAGLPLWIMPIPAFAAGALTAFIYGLFLASRTGVAFVMITMALATLTVSTVDNFDSIFGGESGVSIDRAFQDSFLGLVSFGPQRQAYWLVLAWTALAAGLMWLLTRTAFGQLAAATRENEERVRFSGQSTYRIRLVAMVLAGGFAGLAGALHAINIEQVSVEQFSLKTSAFAMFMCVIGGARVFYGPILGAVLLSALDKVLPGYTGSWPMYLGLVFCAVLIFSPDGLAGIGKGIAQAFRAPGARVQVLGRLLGRALAVAVLAFGTILAVEMATVLSSQEAMVVRDAVPVLGLSVDATSPTYWLLALALIAAGAWGAKHLVPPTKSAGAEVPHA